MKTSVLLVAVLAAAGCSKKDNNNEAPAPGAKPTTDPGTAPGATTPGTTAPTPGATPGGAKLDCDKILPQALRDKHFKDKKIENVPGVADGHGQCKIGYATISLMCDATLKNAKQASLEALPKSNPNMKPIEGVPDSLAHEVGAGYQFIAYDSDSDCKIDGVVEKPADGPAFVKDWLAALPLK